MVKKGEMYNLETILILMVGQCEMFVTRLICATETLDLCSN